MEHPGLEVLRKGLLNLEYGPGVERAGGGTEECGTRAGDAINVVSNRANKGG